MAKQPTKAMTLREAVEIVALGRLKYGEKAYWAAPKHTTPSKRKEAEAQGFADWDRARAIVDAAVEAHEAKCDRLDKGHAHSEPAMDARVGRAFQKLRALERGEDAP